MCNFGRKHQRYLAAMQYNKRRLLGLDSAFFYNNHYRKHVDQLEVRLLDIYHIQLGMYGPDK